MSEAIQLDDYIGVDRKSRGGGGGDMDDVSKRLGTVEASVTELRVQVSGIAAIIPHLATKEDLKEVRGQVGSIAAIIPHLATKADIHALEAKIIKWIIATVIAAVTTTSGLAFTI